MSDMSIPNIISQILSRASMFKGMEKPLLEFNKFQWFRVDHNIVIYDSNSSPSVSIDRDSNYKENN